MTAYPVSFPRPTYSNAPGISPWSPAQAGSATADPNLGRMLALNGLLQNLVRQINSPTTTSFDIGQRLGWANNALQNPRSPLRAPSAVGSNGATPATGSKKDFIDAIAPMAIAEQRRTGIPASVTIAQAILESAWGKSGLTRSANALFGIKGKGSAGSYVGATTEWGAGGAYGTRDGFRAYGSWAESVADHSSLLQNGRYGWALQHANNPDQYARAIHESGYATDPGYSDKLIDVMRRYNLYGFDQALA